MNIFDIIGIVLVAVGLLILILFCVISNHNYRIIGKGLIISLIFIVLASSFFISGIIAREKRKSYETCIYDNIVSLERDNEIQGRFVLGSGYIRSNICYYFYINTNKGYKIEKISITQRDVYIVETNDRKPSVWEKKEKYQEPYYIIYVPTGTIIKEFKG